jgi:hypothetical protein
MKKQSDLMNELLNWVNGNAEEIEILEVNEVGTSLEVFINNNGTVQQVYIPADAEATIKDLYKGDLK